LSPAAAGSSKPLLGWGPALSRPPVLRTEHSRRPETEAAPKRQREQGRRIARDAPTRWSATRVDYGRRAPHGGVTRTGARGLWRPAPDTEACARRPFQPHAPTKVPGQSNAGVLNQPNALLFSCGASRRWRDAAAVNGEAEERST